MKYFSIGKRSEHIQKLGRSQKMVTTVNNSRQDNREGCEEDWLRSQRKPFWISKAACVILKGRWESISDSDQSKYKSLETGLSQSEGRCQKDCRRTLGKGGGGARPGKTEADHTAPPTLWRSVWVLMHPARFPGWGAKVRRGRSIVKVTEHPSVEAIRYPHFLTVCSVSRLCPSGQCPCHSAEPLDGSWHPSHLFLFPKDLFWYWMSLLIRVYRFQPIV